MADPRREPLSRKVQRRKQPRQVDGAPAPSGPAKAAADALVAADGPPGGIVAVKVHSCILTAACIDEMMSLQCYKVLKSQSGRSSVDLFWKMLLSTRCIGYDQSLYKPLALASGPHAASACVSLSVSHACDWVLHLHGGTAILVHD